MFKNKKLKKLQNDVDNLWNDSNNIYYYCKRSKTSSRYPEWERRIIDLKNISKEKKDEIKSNRNIKLKNGIYFCFIPSWFEGVKMSNSSSEKIKKNSASQYWSDLSSDARATFKKCRVCDCEIEPPEEKGCLHENWFYNNKEEDKGKRQIFLSKMYVLCNDCHNLAHFNDILIDIDDFIKNKKYKQAKNKYDKLLNYYPNKLKLFFENKDINIDEIKKMLSYLFLLNAEVDKQNGKDNYELLYSESLKTLNDFIKNLNISNDWKESYSKKLLGKLKYKCDERGIKVDKVFLENYPIDNTKQK